MRQLKRTKVAEKCKPIVKESKCHAFWDDMKNPITMFRDMRKDRVINYIKYPI